VDAKLKQALLAVTSEYNKKQKCVKLEKVEREKAMQIFDMTTKEAASGVLCQLDASLVIKLGNFVNVSSGRNEHEFGLNGISSCLL
jgi:hypothetical protein